MRVARVLHPSMGAQKREPTLSLRNVIANALVLCACLGVRSSTVLAQSTEPLNPRFFARAAIGPGYVKLQQDPKGQGLVIDHPGAAWDLAVGGTVWKGLSVHGTYFGAIAFRPEVKTGSVATQSGDKTSFSLLGLGPGVTYHFQPLNLYVSYSAGVGFSVLRFYEHKLNVPAGWSNVGFANELVVGKEWWVWKRLALGVGAQGMYARVVDRGGAGVDYHYNSFGGGLLLSATYHAR